MPLFEFTKGAIVPVSATSFTSEGIAERADLQRLLRTQIDVIAGDVLVIGEEFGDWEDSKRRIDLLAVDRDANLVVIELKRTDDGGHVELQAIRYAAMVSAMTFEQASSSFAKFLHTQGATDDAQARLLEFLGWDEPDEENFAQDVRIVLVSADFSREVTTAVLWLNQRNLDIRCVRLKPYKLGDRVLIDAEQIIPLPEAQDYQVHMREKNDREREARQRRIEEPWTGFFYVNISEGPHRSWKDCRNYGFVAAGQGANWSSQLERLHVGAKLYAYFKGKGYVGFGVVVGPRTLAKQFQVLGRSLLDHPLAQPGMKTNMDDPVLAEWVVPVRWIKTVDAADARKLAGGFSSQLVVCKLRHPETLRFLAAELGDSEG